MTDSPLKDYYAERYQGLERQMLSELKDRLIKKREKLTGFFLNSSREALNMAAKVQEEEKNKLAYMSFSWLNISLIENKPCLQIDFYDYDWIYGYPWARSYMPADFLFEGFEAFSRDALDEKYFVRGSLQPAEIRTLFWGTVDKMLYVLAGQLKYILPMITMLKEFGQLEREEWFYITFGTYIDWHERMAAMTPELDLDDIDANEETRLRRFEDKVFHGKVFEVLNLNQCRFTNCLFDKCVFAGTILDDAFFSTCRFRDVEFKDVSLRGTAFLENKFLRVKFTGSDEADANIMTSDSGEYYDPIKFVQCYLREVTANYDLTGREEINCLSWDCSW